MVVYGYVVIVDAGPAASDAPDIFGTTLLLDVGV
jgi:hypothetical protein